MRHIRLWAVLCTIGLAPPLNAGIPFEENLVCPIGGEEFVYVSTASHTTYGERPDGKPYGSWIFPMPMPECPTNKLVLYRNFEAAEIATLTELIESADYRSLHGETTYYRASWLSARLDPEPGLAPVVLLLQASWQADEQPAVKSRYQREFATMAETISIDAEQPSTMFLRYRVANAWRELGEFEAATAALDTIPMEALDVEIPEGDSVPYRVRDEAEGLRYLLGQIDIMRRVIEAGDSSSEQVDLLPSDIASWRCEELSEAGEAQLPARCTELMTRSAIDERSTVDTNGSEAAADAAVQAAAEAVEAAINAMSEETGEEDRSAERTRDQGDNR